MKQEQFAQELTIYVGEDDQWQGKPLYAAIIDRLRQSDVRGATILKGVEGYGAHKQLHSSKVEVLFQGLPLLIRVVDSADKIAAALKSIEDLLSEALITINDVTAIEYSARLEEHQ
jgi:PII-like signaling protein